MPGFAGRRRPFACGGDGYGSEASSVLWHLARPEHILLCGEAPVRHEDERSENQDKALPRAEECATVRSQADQICANRRSL